MGFRECLAEVSRYLERIEGMDAQNPMRLRLTSHLQCCAAQKELALKQAASTPWSYGSTQAYAPPLNPLSSPNHGSLNTHQPPGLPPPIHHQNMHHDLGHYDVSTSCAQSIPPLPPSDTSRLAPPSTSLLTPLTTTTSSALAYSPHHQYPPPVNSFGIPASSSHHQNYSQSIPTSQGMKPYRPWGAEVAY